MTQEDKRVAAAYTMRNYGGAFAAAIGQAYLVADAANRERLAIAFADIFEKYSRMGGLA